MKPALLLIDIQQDYFPGGRMEVAGAVEAGRTAGLLLNFFRGKTWPIVHVQHISTRPGATFLLPDTGGIDFHDTVKPRAGETVIQKNFPNSFRDTDLREHFRAGGIKDLVVCGMMSHMCVDTTVRAAFDMGYSCLVAHDACAARAMTFNGLDIPADHVHGAYMAALNAVFARVLSTRDILNLLSQ